MLTFQLADFVQLHKLSRGDTLQSLAIAYNTSEVTLRVLNNLLSDRALPAHVHVFVPVRGLPDLEGKWLRIASKVGGMRRIAAVVYQGDEAACLDSVVPTAGDEALELKANILSQALKMPVAMARYYVHEAQGDLGSAKERHEADENWEWSTEGQALLQGYRCRSRRAWCRKLCGVINRWLCCGAMSRSVH